MAKEWKIVETGSRNYYGPSIRVEHPEHHEVSVIVMAPKGSKRWTVARRIVSALNSGAAALETCGDPSDLDEHHDLCLWDPYDKVWACNGSECPVYRRGQPKTYDYNFTDDFNPDTDSFMWDPSLWDRICSMREDPPTKQNADALDALFDLKGRVEALNARLSRLEDAQGRDD